jgi:hypothetical protein
LDFGPISICVEIRPRLADRMSFSRASEDVSIGPVVIDTSGFQTLSTLFRSRQKCSTDTWLAPLVEISIAAPSLHIDVIAALNATLQNLEVPICTSPSCKAPD